MFGKKERPIQGPYVLKVLYPGEKRAGYLLKDGLNFTAKICDGHELRKLFETPEEAFDVGLEKVVMQGAKRFVVEDLEGNIIIPAIYRGFVEVNVI